MTDIDDDYLVLPAARSCITGQCYFTKHTIEYYHIIPTTDGHILTEQKTLKPWFPLPLNQKQVAISKFHKI